MVDGDVFVHSRTDAWIYSARINQHGHSGSTAHADRTTGLCHFNTIIVIVFVWTFATVSENVDAAIEFCLDF